MPTTTLSAFLDSVVKTSWNRPPLRRFGRHNPYDKVGVRLERNEAAENEDHEIHTTNGMGIQSQRREGSIRNCKTRAATSKHRRTRLVIRAIGGGEACISSILLVSDGAKQYSGAR
jgi:hypothetical protein